MSIKNNNNNNIELGIINEIFNSLENELESGKEERTYFLYEYLIDLQPEEIQEAKEIHLWFPISINSLVDIFIRDVYMPQNYEVNFSIIGNSLNDLKKSNA